jgi:CheY-like chemotaxis protein
VLVVDDDEVVRSVLSAGLKRYGFHVWAAASGDEAVQVYWEHAAAIKVLLLDVRMPGVDGPDTLDAIHRLDPGVAACFLSGDTGPYGAEELVRRGASRVLTKPIGLGQLAEALRSVAQVSRPPCPT